MPKRKQPASRTQINAAMRLLEGEGFAIVERSRVRELSVSLLMPHTLAVESVDPDARKETMLKTMWDALQAELREHTAVNIEDVEDGKKITSSIIIINAGDAE